MARFLPESYHNVLEIGCAAGGFYSSLKQPCEVWGVEPNAEAAHVAALNLNKVIVGCFSDVIADIPDGYFDLVICNDVIEHMNDHDVFLRNIKSKMRPGGHLVGSVPNIRHITALFKILIKKDWEYSESGILDRTHLRFFTKKSLLRTLREHAYHVEDIAGIGSIIRYGIARMVNKPKKWENLIYRTTTLAVILLTLGFYWDTQFPQYGFRVRLA
jgi:2-polyprenyl-3-methyl-5-hydroxy-6-metoxy-1,4-benzoquinol methylase